MLQSPNHRWNLWITIGKVWAGKSPSVKLMEQLFCLSFLSRHDENLGRILARLDR